MRKKETSGIILHALNAMPDDLPVGTVALLRIHSLRLMDYLGSRYIPVAVYKLHSNRYNFYNADGLLTASAYIDDKGHIHHYGMYSYDHTPALFITLGFAKLDFDYKKIESDFRKKFCGLEVIKLDDIF